MGKVLIGRRVWAAMVGVIAVLALLYMAYLPAVISPQENLEDLPVVLVNEDRGGELAGEEVVLGEEIVERVTGTGSPAGDTVEWTPFERREQALEGLRNKEFYGAIVIPADYTERLASAAGPPEVSLALVNGDEGAELGGEPVAFGEQVVEHLIAADSPAAGAVDWSRVEWPEEVAEGFERGEFYAAVVVPTDYSKRLAGLAAPTGGAPPEPAELELRINPRVNPSMAGEIEAAFASVVEGVSGATRERILESLSRAEAQVPPQVAAALAEPVRGEVVEAGPTSGGELPPPPEPAEIEVITNPAAGQGSQIAEGIMLGIVRSVSEATSARISSAAAERGAQLPPEFAAVVGNPVRAEVTEAVALGENSGNGGVPFFLAFLGGLSGAIGAAVVYFGISRAGSDASRARLWSARVLLGVVFAALAAGAEVGVAFGVLDVDRSVGVGWIYLFLALAVAAVLFVTMLLAELFGYAGFILSALLNIILGLVSSGGFAPVQALPDPYQLYSEWLPLRHAADGLRALLFYDGRPAAGLESALWVLGTYGLLAVALGYGVALVRDVRRPAEAAR